VAVPEATATATMEPTQTETPVPLSTDTIAPSPSASATQTPLPPTATPLPLGQGGWIAFASDRADGKTLQLWLLRAWLNDQGQVETGDLTQLTTSEGDKRQPAWSPDGRELLFVALGEAGQGLDIWKIPVDGSAPAVNVTRRKGDQTDPAWSPDGARIAFTDNSREDGVPQLYLIDPSGSNLLHLSFDQNESDPAWSPDMKSLGFVLNAGGSRVFFLRAPQDPKAATPQPPFYVTPQPFDRSAVLGNLGQVGEPAWSPDGAFLAYTRLKKNGERVFLARIPVRDPATDILALAEGSRDLSPAWSPDSQWIAFVSYRDGNAELYVMRSTGKNQNRLTDAPGQDLDPAWQPLVH
jgi:eukaryotic-like serine/threonine-protein kinase